MSSDTARSFLLRPDWSVNWWSHTICHWKLHLVFASLSKSLTTWPHLLYNNKKTYIIVIIVVVIVIVYDTSRYWDSTHKEIHESKSWYSSSRWACSFGFLFGLFSFINFVSSLCSAKKFIFSINDVCNCFMYMVELFQIWNTVILSLIMIRGMVNWVRAISF